jgi:urea transport system substrate-binding protein
LIVSAIGVALTLSALTTVPAAPAPYVLGWIGSLSGPGAVFADQGIQSAKLALKEVNDAKILDRPVEITVSDDASDPKTANSVCTRLVHQDHVAAIIGFENSADRKGCLPVATAGGMIPYLYATPYEGKECVPNFFVFGEVPNQEVQPLVQYMAAEQHAKKWYFIGSDYVAMRGGNEFARTAVQKLGGQVIGEEYAPLGTTEFTPLIDKLMRSGADTLLYSVLGSDGNAFLKQLHDTPGADKLKVSTFTIPIGAGNAAKGIYLAFSYFPSIKNAKNEQYKTALKAMFGSKAQIPSILSVVNYDAVWMWGLAVQKARSAAPAAVNKAMKEISFDGPRGVIKFNDQGHPALPMYIAQLNGDPLSGTETIVKSFPPVAPSNQCSK